MSHKSNGDSPRPDVSIIVINWNTDELLEQCIDSIIRNTNVISYEMMIIDNNSAGTGFQRVKHKFSQYGNFTWIENSENIGGIANNRVLPYCKGRYLLLLGPDTIVLPQCLENMVNFLDNAKEAGAVTAKLLNPDGSPQNYYFRFWNLSMFFFSTTVGRLVDNLLFKNKFKQNYFGGNIDSNKITVIEQPAGACFMFRRDPVATDYITDEDLPFFFGDADLCKRIYAVGYKIFLLPSAQVIHFAGSSFKKSDTDWKLKEYKSSAIKYLQKYHRYQALILRLMFLMAQTTQYISSSFRRVALRAK